MPPKTNAVDGISKVGVAQPPLPSAPSLNVNKSSQPAPAAESPEKAPKNEVKAAKTLNKQTTTILITLIVMVLLIGLAYLAYHKSN